MPRKNLFQVSARPVLTNGTHQGRHNWEQPIATDANSKGKTCVSWASVSGVLKLEQIVAKYRQARARSKPRGDGSMPRFNIWRISSTCTCRRTTETAGSLNLNLGRSGTTSTGVVIVVGELRNGGPVQLARSAKVNVAICTPKSL